MKTHRINTGLYGLEIDGNTFEIEKAECGLWDLFLKRGADRHPINDFIKKSDAVEYLRTNHKEVMKLLENV